MRKTIIVGVAAVAALTLSACGGGSSNKSSSTNAGGGGSESSTSTTASGESDPVAAADALTWTEETEDGYTMTFVINPPSLTIDTADAKPGEQLVSVVNGGGTVTNTTPGGRRLDYASEGPTMRVQVLVPAIGNCTGNTNCVFIDDQYFYWLQGNTDMLPEFPSRRTVMESGETMQFAAGTPDGAYVSDPTAVDEGSVFTPGFCWTVDDIHGELTPQPPTLVYSSNGTATSKECPGAAAAGHMAWNDARTG